MTTALFIGRFQPLHIGHLYVITELAERYEHVKIGIGSSQHSHTPKNPLSAEEREEMLTAVLNAQKITNVTLYCIPDINSNEKWVDHVQGIVGDYNVIHSGNSLVIRLFEGKGVTVEKISHVDPYKATHIRQAVCDHKTIEQHVPPSVYNYLLRIDALNRIRQVCCDL
jgi:nicotinamide-nucleotide adenylyltransferase